MTGPNVPSWTAAGLSALSVCCSLRTVSISSAGRRMADRNGSDLRCVTAASSVGPAFAPNPPYRLSTSASGVLAAQGVAWDFQALQNAEVCLGHGVAMTTVPTADLSPCSLSRRRARRVWGVSVGGCSNDGRILSWTLVRVSSNVDDTRNVTVTHRLVTLAPCPLRRALDCLLAFVKRSMTSYGLPAT